MVNKSLGFCEGPRLVLRRVYRVCERTWMEADSWVIVMADVIKAIKERHSSRGKFDSSRPVSKEKLKVILDAARWAPTAHNMQNYEIVLIDDEDLIKAIGGLESVTSEAFIRENFRQLSMSEDELKRKKVGILGQPVPAQMEGCGQARRGGGGGGALASERHHQGRKNNTHCRPRHEEEGARFRRRHPGLPEPRLRYGEHLARRPV